MHPAFTFAGDSRVLVRPERYVDGSVVMGLIRTAGYKYDRAWRADTGQRCQHDSLRVSPAGDCFAAQYTTEAGYGVGEPRDESVAQVRAAADGALLAEVPLPPRHAVRAMIDARTLLVSHHGRLMRWDVATGREACGAELSGRKGIDDIHAAVSPDGRKVIAVRRQAAYHLDAETMQVVRELAFPITALIHCVAYSPDGLTAAFGTGKRRFVIWDVD